MSAPSCRIPTIWITGLPSSGKSTLAALLHRSLTALDMRSEVLDGDELRAIWSPDLGFSREDRLEQGRRVTLLCQYLRSRRIVPIVALVSPYVEARAAARRSIGENFVEVFLNCPLRVCIRRDSKRLYARAIRGELRDVTGVDAPYEPPERPELTLRTDLESPGDGTRRVLEFLLARGYGACPDSTL